MRARHGLAVALIAFPAVAEDTLPSRLAGHAVIPALSLLAPPADAPRDAWISGKFASGLSRNEVPMSAQGDTGALHGKRPTGIGLPFIGQPLQGFSGLAINRAKDGSFYTLSDNGFGSKLNSADALLSYHRIAPDFLNGTVARLETVNLRDPDKKVPFRIVHEGTDARYLTGGDFDPESIQVDGETIWIGDEFGPFLIEAGLDGVVHAVHETKLGDAVLKSPDHPSLRAGVVAGKDFTVQRSGGYEGMALNPETGVLWGMLEKPLLGEDGQPGGGSLTVLAFDPAKGDWTGDSFRFALADGATAIGDFNFIDGTRALVIERDDGEGDPSLACADLAAPEPDCFPVPAKLKRIVLIDTATLDADGFARRIAHVDLMAIDDAEGLARLQTVAARDLAGTYTFPYFTIESVVQVDSAHILVGNDNNLPFSSGRALDAAADNEFLLLNVPELLAAQ